MTNLLFGEIIGTEVEDEVVVVVVEFLLSLTTKMGISIVFQEQGLTFLVL